MGHMGPISGRSLNQGVEPWAPRPPWWLATPLPLFVVGISPTLGREGEEPLPLGLYIVEEGSPFSHNTISLRSLSPLSLSLVWFPLFGAGTRGLRFLYHPDTVALPKSGSESIFLHCSAGSEPGGRRIHRTCVRLRGAARAALLHRREVLNMARRPLGIVQLRQPRS